MKNNKIQICYCGTPLIWTFAFSKKEWLCLNCGNTYAMFYGDRTDRTPELEKQLKELEAEFRPVERDLLVVGTKYKDCELCSSTNDYSHLDHATEEEKEKDFRAREWLSIRTGKTVVV